MRKIKFSHEYAKMPEGFERSALLEVFIADRSDLCPEFVEYDTAIIGAGNYPLPRGKLLVLLLQAEYPSLELWTTIRRHRTLTPDPPQAAAEPTMLEATKQAWQACRRRG